ncbi:MAG: hypothetical protein L3J80_01435 [Thermoplasmata archaeon]|nr:hypothetical protein [Thermoplasmata archaeon]
MRRGALLTLSLALVALVVTPVGLGVGGGNSGISTAPPAVPAATTPSSIPLHGPAAVPSAPDAGGASGRILVGTSDGAAVPNDGIQSNLTAFPTVTFPADSSFQTGAEEVIGGYEAVFGLFTNTAMAPTAFYTIFTNTSDQTVRLVYWVSLPILAGAPYDFVLQRASGTVWTLSVNGQTFGDNASAASFDFGASSSTWLGGIGFSELAIYSASSTVPSSYLATAALAVHRLGSGWYVPQNGTANYTGPTGAAWGAEGRIQLGGLAPDEVESGTSLAPLRNATGLWSTGALPVTVSLSFTGPSVLGLSVVGVDVNVTTLGGAPLGGVPVFLGDTLGGSASPPTVFTSQDGTSASLLTAPNVSAPSTDVVQATVTILGYSGSASGSVAVTPAEEVVIDATRTSVTLAPGASTTLTFQTLDVAGHPYPLVALTLTPEFAVGAVGTYGGAGVVVQPDAGITDPNASFSATLLAPPQAGAYAVLASVVSLGAWGHATVSVTVRPPPPSFWAQYGPSRIVPAIGVLAFVVVVAVVALWVRRRRGKHQPLPEMDLRKMRQDTEAGRTPVGTGPPVSRTPPGSSTP